MGDDDAAHHPAGAAVSAAADLEGLPPPGSVIAGKYEVARVLGRGGMGVVVQARHLRMERDVALKILLPALRAQPEVVARFEREGRAAAQLRDVHVTRVLDVDTLEDGTPFIVMELLRGNDLSDILAARGKLPVRDAVGYLLEACAAMAEAHRAGIVHRDLKPNNLFVDRQGERPVLKVLDFGISKVTSDVAASMTATSTAFGTPLYMSPEQVRSAKNVDGRADIWSLGVVLYELLTGQSPFYAESATAILAAIIADAPVPVAERRPDLPRPLADAVMRALEKDAAARFQDVQSFAAALAPFAPEGDTAVIMPSLRPPPMGSAETTASTNVPPRVTTAAPKPAARGGFPVVPIALGMVLALAAGSFLLLAIGRRAPLSPTARAEPTVPVGRPAADPEPLVAPVAAPPSPPPPAPTAVAAAPASLLPPSPPVASPPSRPTPKPPAPPAKPAPPPPLTPPPPAAPPAQDPTHL
jgi:eukaryotic-like serine/threonine-protein kinase